LSEWQPIETAPKQGTNEISGRILLFAPSTEWSSAPVIVTAYWDDTDCKECVGWHIVEADGTESGQLAEDELSDFTHWMPMPPKPVK
jgi:hypothetical protein